MPSTTPLTDAINALTTYANTVTGQNDPDLSTAVATLAAGYGGGGDDHLLDIIEGNITDIYDNSITTLAVQISMGNKIQSMFWGALETISLSNAMGFNTALTVAVCPALTDKTGYDQYRGCTSLVSADFGANLQKLDNWTFENCPALNTLILRRSNAITAMQGTSALSQTCFGSGKSGGTIYIPQSLYDHLGDNSALDYKHASNWSTFEGYGTITWAKIEGSYYETHYADGTVIS